MIKRIHSRNRSVSIVTAIRPRVFLLLSGVILTLGLLLDVAAESQTAEQIAELKVHGKRICTGPGATSEDFTMTYSLLLPEDEGPVFGEGNYVNNDSIHGVVLSGPSTIAGEVLNSEELVLTKMRAAYDGMWMDSTAPFGPTETQQIRLAIEPGSEKTIPFQNAKIGPKTSCHGYYTYQLNFKQIEKWNLTYKGYDVLHFDAEPISGRRLQDGSPDQLVGGLKVNWNLSVDFRVQKTKKGKTYLDGNGTAKVTGTEGYSKPSGVYDCHVDENPVPVSKDTFNVPGSISGETVKLTLPENNYYVTIDCVMDTDALKDYIRANNPQITKFPRLENLPKHLRDQFKGNIVNPGHKTRTMLLQEHSKIVTSNVHEGLEYSLIKQK